MIMKIKQNLASATFIIAYVVTISHESIHYNRIFMYFTQKPSIKKATPVGVAFIIGGECEIRTHGGSPHH